MNAIKMLGIYVDEDEQGKPIHTWNMQGDHTWYEYDYWNERGYNYTYTRKNDGTEIYNVYEVDQLVYRKTETSDTVEEVLLKRDSYGNLKDFKKVTFNLTQEAAENLYNQWKK